MPEEISILSSLFVQTGEGLDNIISILRRGNEPVSHPETIVWYQDATISSYEIEGELGQNSITNRKNAVKIEIGSNATSIGEYTFESCSNLTSITIPSSVTSVGKRAFQRCLNLTSIDIPSSVSSIGSGAFYTCTGLTSITVNPSNSIYDSRNNCNAIVQTANNTLIAGCKTTTIYSTITSIGSGAFTGSSLTSITIPDSVTSIGDYAFQSCQNLTSINIPSNVTKIDDGTFSNCSAFTEITIPAKVTSIGKFAFFACSSLSSITSLRTTAPTVQTNSFGTGTTNYTGRNSYSAGTNILKVPTGATGYTSSYWNSVLLTSTKCGFHVEYI